MTQRLALLVSLAALVPGAAATVRAQRPVDTLALSLIAERVEAGAGVGIVVG
ncbi:MAG: hypothetical protein H0U85_00340, partial [Gemmatimonadales bacterium]|nr:hypothetical protein [Gemmatimonadales bacterium]